jgi:hypothetical protein
MGKQARIEEEPEISGSPRNFTPGTPVSVPALFSYSLLFLIQFASRETGVPRAKRRKGLFKYQ